MKIAYLYRIGPDREPVFITRVTVSDVMHDEIARNHRINPRWYTGQGYDPATHFLRTAQIIETTPAERTALHRAAEKLRREGKLPSAADRIIGKLSDRARR